MNREELLKKYEEPTKIGYDGHIALVDVMGDDDRVADVARTSYGKGTKKTRGNRSLLRYLMRHKHTSPYEQAVATFAIRIPMDIWRQFIRHRTLSVNEYSTRYSEAIDSMARTDPAEWRRQSTSNKQGSEGFLDLEVGASLSDQETALQEAARAVYEARLALGVAREQARKDLPLSTYTEAIFTVDLHNLLHFAGLRSDSHAQKEIREFSLFIEEIIKDWCPHTYEAFVDYRKEAHTFSRQEMELLKLWLEGTEPLTEEEAKSRNITFREMREFNRILNLQEDN